MKLNGQNVLVTGARSPVATVLMQQLIDAGYSVWATDSVPFALGKNLKGIKGYTNTVACRFHELDYINEINGIVKEHAIEIIIPSNEETFYLSKHRNELFAKLFAGDFNTIAKLHNKIKYAEILTSAGLKTPHNYKTEMPNTIKKNIYSRFTAINEVDTNSDYFYQEKINGKEWCISVIAEDGEIKFGTVYDKEINYKGSSAIYIENKKQFAILAEFQKLIKKTNFTGLIGADVIEDSNHDLYFIDINPRGTSGLMLLNASFWNGEKPEITKPISNNFLLILDLWKHPKKTFTRMKSANSFFDLIDVKSPTVVTTSQIFNWLCYAHKNKLKLRDAMVYDIEWDG